MAPNKRPHKTLTLAEKCKILECIDKGGSIRSISDQFGVPKSTISDIKKHRNKIRSFVAKSYQGPGKRRVMKKAENPEVEIALYNWFLQQRHAHVPVSSGILQAKAKYFYEQITGKNDFLASAGWLDKFKKRHGVRFLKVSGEKLSSDIIAVSPFQEKFRCVVQEMGLSRDQVYNADESTAFWRALPDTTWVHSQEKSAPGRKISKERVTFMPCSNASGQHKLPLLILGKAANPRALKNCILPVDYKSTTKGWMTRPLFMEWFRKCFIPKVKIFLTENNRPHKALLLVDNAPSHPPEEEINFDPDFRVIFLPPNCTAILQPMDQNLIQNIKVAYRKRLLDHLISREDGDVTKVLKEYNLKDALYNLDAAWKGISEKNIQKSWTALWPQEGEDIIAEELDEESISLAELRKRLCPVSSEDLNNISDALQIIDPNSKLSEKEIVDWAVGEKEFVSGFTEEELIHEALKTKETNDNQSSETEEDNIVLKVKHSDAVKALSKSIQWAEENDVSMQGILLLKGLKEKAVEAVKSKSVQTKIDSFFKKS